MIDPVPWKNDLPLAPLRAFWILAAVFLFPSLFLFFSMPIAYAMLLSSLLALPACWGKSGELGANMLSLSDLRIIFAAYFGIILLGTVVSPLWEELIVKLNIECAKEQDIVELFRSANARDRVLMLISTCIITPVVEEVLFRRIFYDWFLRLTKNCGTAVILTSMLFSVVHFFILGIPGLFIMGAGFQLVYLLKRNLSAAIALHAVVNSIASLAQLFLPEELLN